MLGSERFSNLVAVLHYYHKIFGPLFGHKNVEIFDTDNAFIFVWRTFISLFKFLTAICKWGFHPPRETKWQALRLMRSPAQVYSAYRTFLSILYSDVKPNKFKSNSALSFLHSIPCFLLPSAGHICRTLALACRVALTPEPEPPPIGRARIQFKLILFWN